MNTRRSVFVGAEADSQATELPITQRRRAISYSVTRASIAFSLLLATATASWGVEADKAREQLGKVSFPNSCDSAVQAMLQRGVALLHSFWWQKGRQAFLDVLEHDPSCAIATWGIAAIDIGNPFATGPSPAQAQQAQEAIAHGRSIGAKTERERLYIEAIASYYDRFAEPHVARMKSLADAFEALATRYPHDDETQTFYALYMTASQPADDRSFASGIGGDHRSAKLNHEPPVELKPEKLTTRFTRRVRHGRLDQ